MSNLFDRGMATLITHMKGSIGRIVQYTWGQYTAVAGANPKYTAVGTGPLTVWVGRTLFEKAAAVGGATKEWGERDYFVTVADFHALAGASATPLKGDRIQDLDTNLATIVYELHTPTNEPVQRFSDQGRWVYRLHCKRVA